LAHKHYQEAFHSGAVNTCQFMNKEPKLRYRWNKHFGSKHNSLQNNAVHIAINFWQPEEPLLDIITNEYVFGICWLFFSSLFSSNIKIP